ncbi:hypothetical protein KC365_g13172 [Hortaea werneckii]|nr:hypothetical protein KC365_g13172 [Hortaea werneckii]
MPLVLAIQQHHETVSLDVVDMASHDVVMGIFWFEKHNPLIDWRKRVLKFERCGCVTDIHPIHRQRAMVDEERPCELERQPITYSDRNGKEMVSTDTEPAQPGYKPPYLDINHGITEYNFSPAKIHYGGHYTGYPKRSSKSNADGTKENLDKGWIEKFQSSAASPPMFVPKKIGNKTRMVIDYRRLNEITVKNRYPLPNIEEMQDRLTGADWYSKVDLRDAFYASHASGTYEKAPATCQQLVNDVLRDLLDLTVIAYVDDILIFTQGSREQHTKDVQAVLERLSTVDFKTAPEKCEFYKQEIEFLGFIINTTGIKMDPKKIQSIQEWPTLKNVTEIQAVLGLANYNRKFVEGYFEFAIPLTSLPKKDTKFMWTEKQEKAFQQLKRACIQSPTLMLFDTNKPV